MRNIVVNEAAVKYMELKEPVGEIIRWGGFQFKIVGVVKDMIMESPFNPVRQTMYPVCFEDAIACIHIRINPKISAGDALVKMETIFRKLVPSVPFDYEFVDTEYAEKFAAEERIGNLASFFAALAIFISCLGLFGLASFIAEKRQKKLAFAKCWELLYIISGRCCRKNL